ncbi:MAG: MATE family efflux transporter [Paludibacteraceae bacterium]|jgi:MATE family multidrug resistance protein|nr:MATE family efflux transporter [Paludibacteraceae bacterium]
MSLITYVKGYIPFYRRNLKIALPVMFAQLGQAIVMLADTVMVGHLGTVELAAVSFGSSVFMIGFLFALGLSIGATPLIGKEYAAGEHRRSAIIFQNSILFDIGVSLVLGGIMWAVSFFMDRMGQPDEVWPLAQEYFRISVYTLPFVLLFQSFRQFMEGIGNTKYAMVITLVGNILNIFLNWVLIFGKLGCPMLGVAGAAYATLIARILMSIAFVVLFFVKRPLIRYFYFFGKKSFSRREIKGLAYMGIPIGSQMLLETLGMSLSSIMVGWFGAVALASHQIAMNLSSLTFMISSGLASATTIRVSHQIGVKDFKSMRKAGIASTHLSLLFSCACAIVLFFFRVQIASVFSVDPQVLELSSLLIAIVAIYQFGDGFQVVSIGALRGMSDVYAPMVVAIVCYLIVNLSMAYLLAVIFNWGAVGVWIAFMIELYLAAILLGLRFRHKTKLYR